MVRDINKLREMIDFFDIKDKQGNILKHNKFKNCFTEKFLYNKNSCEWASNHEAYLSGLLEEDPELYMYSLNNQGVDTAKQDSAGEPNA